jgi:hypothetical protein
VETNPSNIRIFPTNICIEPLALCHQVIKMDVRMQMFTDVRWVGSHPLHKGLLIFETNRTGLWGVFLQKWS